MYDFIDYAGEKRPNWSDDQFYWMAVCEYIAAHWYFILTMDEYTFRNWQNTSSDMINYGIEDEDEDDPVADLDELANNNEQEH